MAAPPRIVELVELFERNKKQYMHPSYNETQLRREFVDPLFEELGWDVNNRSGKAEAYKDVIHEDSIKIGKSTKAPDYSFRIGGVRKFFVETKKPSVNVKSDIAPAYQVRRYSWSAKLPLGILTDFEEISVYDCRKKPSPKDSANVGRILYIKYSELVERWDELANVFSKDSIEKGDFARYVESTRTKRGTSEVDDEFLKEIEKWRNELAKNIALRNMRLDVHQLNFVVQKTIDRIIFLRICEDRGIEPYGQLQEIAEKDNVYDRLKALYEAADEKYNSGIFHFKEEKGQASYPDTLSNMVKIDDKVLKDIIKRLYYPECPYEFSVLSVDILGNVYEQFLGKVIRLTKGHRAVVEEKPEVKKAGGVYYTPKYIVDYIVKKTVGKLVKGKRPKQIEKIKVLDPACGSGSFLIGAYGYLLDYHRDWYVEHNPEKHTKEIYQGKGGQWYLTTQEKKKILLNNIYGVDIDTQAVEVTKLNLLLRVLENESQDTLLFQKKLVRERALPDLAKNIKCGNSLIGPDFYSGQSKLFEEEEERKINVFDWKTEFPFKFDAVIGNPPYINNRNLPESNKIYFEKKYTSAYQQYDIYVLFYECGLRLLKEQGYLGFITPNKFAITRYGERLRKLFLENVIEIVVDVSQLGVFPTASTYPYVIILQKKKPLRNKIRIYTPKSSDFNQMNETKIKQSSLISEEPFLFNLTDKELQLLSKITGVEVIDIFRAKPTTKNINETGNTIAITNKEIDKYNLRESEKRIDGEDSWKIRVPAILMKKVCYVPTATLLEDDSYVPVNTVYVIHSLDKDVPLEYMLGILNSKLIGFYTRKKYGTTAMRGGFIELRTFEIETIPIKLPSEKQKDQLVNLVRGMLTSNKEIKEFKGTPDEKTSIQRRIDALDSEIDKLVYGLYGLTGEEIKIVENAENE